MERNKRELILEQKFELKIKLAKEFPLFFLEMNDAQERFVRVKNRFGKTPRRRILEAANKVGKCLTSCTFIETPAGEVSIGRLFEKGKPFLVYAWDGEKKVIARATAPFKKDGLHQCYRITMSDGRWVEAADYHRVLTTSGEYATVEQLAPFFPGNCRNTSFSFSSTPRVHPQTSSGNSLLIHDGDGRRLIGKESSFQYRCSNGFRQYGELSRGEVKTDRVFSPLQGGVQKHNYVLSDWDGLGNRYINIPLINSFLRSIPHSVLSFLIRVSGSLENAVCKISQSLPYLFPKYQLLSTTGFSDLQLNYEFDQSQNYTSSVLPCVYPPMCFDGNYIVSINKITSQEVFDTSVEKYHNYFAGGLVHHNTWVGGAEDIAWMCGYRPWLKTDDPDYKVDVLVPNISMLGCETYKHSVAEKIEPMFRFLVPSTCQAKFKPGPTGVLNVLTLVYGPKGEKCGSELHIRSYDEHHSTFEGTDYTGFIHWDEPPPENIWRAAERGKVVSNAPSWFTMTPLSESWIWDRLSLRAGIHA